MDARVAGRCAPLAHRAPGPLAPGARGRLDGLAPARRTPFR